MYIVQNCHDEKSVRRLIRNNISTIESVNPIKEDSYGNFYAMNNEDVPLLCAHMDNVWHETNTTRLQHAQIVDWVLKGTTNIWADDKCGVAIALWLWYINPTKVNVLFTRQEETGWIGVERFISKHSDLLAKCKFTIIADRRGAHDIIGVNNGYCTKEFQDALEVIIWQFGYKPTTWVFSDADALSEVMNSVNLSCGYYDAHTERESVKIAEFENCALAIATIVESDLQRMEKPTRHKYSGSYWRYDMFWDDDWLHSYNRNNWFFYGAKSYNEDSPEDYIVMDWNNVLVDIPLWLIAEDGSQFYLPNGEYRLAFDTKKWYDQLWDQEELVDQCYSCLEWTKVSKSKYTDRNLCVHCEKEMALMYWDVPGFYPMDDDDFECSYCWTKTSILEELQDGSYVCEECAPYYSQK